VESLSPGAPVPIGRPVPGSEVYVLDDAMRPVPGGTTGEVYIGGAGVARGYVGRPGATAERFVPDPFGAPGGVLYRTGDLARWSPGGVLEFAGRADGQVKIRGFRVEPGEVEAALRALPGISAAAVVVRGDGEDRALAAYAVAAPGAACDPAALRTLLAERVPPFLVPATVTLLAALPLTPNGKVDRAALPEPVVGRSSAALTPDEERVAEAWRAELGVEHVGPDDDFFVLGGQSLRAVRVAARIGEAFGIDLPVAAVFQLPTVRALAASAAGFRAAALDERFAWLEALSDEEAEALLREG
jgi:acyl carrier protein